MSIRIDSLGRVKRLQVKHSTLHIVFAEEVCAEVQKNSNSPCFLLRLSPKATAATSTSTSKTYSTAAISKKVAVCQRLKAVLTPPLCQFPD